MNETDDQRQIRLEKQKHQSQSRRAIKTEEQRDNRLQNNRERIRSIQANETEEQRQTRVGQQRERSQTNRTKKKLEKHASDNIVVEPQNIDMQLNETEEQAHCDDDNMTDLTQSKNATNTKKCSISPSWPEAISRGLKETRLQRPYGISNELKDLIISTQSSTAQNFSGINIRTAEHDQSDVPTELQGLTIPEEKLISLYRHNSCVIKLHSPFHSTTTAQSALKGNCITFLQNIPNIVNSLPLRLDDLCETLKVIFVGARPPKRIQLEKILTVRKKKLYKHYIGLRNII
ncbi:unnamed protein product [Rotaria socialis]